MKIPGYKVHRKIGKGGMATVFLATQLSFDRKVALKIIANSAFGSMQLADRFMQEAKIVAGFSHPHIVSVYDVGTIENYSFLAMDYLQGGELKHWIRAGLDTSESEQIIMQIAQALHYAHGKGYVHRDIKPDNILFREDNSAVLTDFGIAKPIRETNYQNTEHGMIVGTPAYMSPEQSQGKTIDARSDLYSLGVMFYHMLAKEQPYTDDQPLALALKHIQDPIPKLPTSLRRYQPLISKLMAKNPDERYKSGLEFCKALQTIIDNPHAEKISIDASLKIVDDSEHHSDKNFEMGEVKYRKLGLVSRYQLNCSIKSDEPQHFSILYGRLTTELAAWIQRRNKQCGKVYFRFSIDEDMANRVTDQVKTLYNDDGPFYLLKDLKSTIELSNIEGKLIKTINV